MAKFYVKNNINKIGEILNEFMQFFKSNSIGELVSTRKSPEDEIVKPIKLLNLE